MHLRWSLCAAGVDLISFSGILYSIYPPLFLALLVYSIGGTGTSLFLGRKLVGLNFQQEAQEANFRCHPLSYCLHAWCHICKTYFLPVASPTFVLRGDRIPSSDLGLASAKSYAAAVSS